MPSKGCAVALAGVGAYAAAQAFVAPTAPQVQEQREVRQLRQQATASVTSTTSSAAALALGAAGVAAAAAQAGKRTQRRCQVVRQATAVAEKTFTKMPASVKPGVVTGQALVDLLNYAKENEFAIPGVNVVSSSSINACMEAAKKAGGPIMVTFSKGGGQFIAGKAADNSDDAASIAGTVAGALHVRQVAKLYGVPVILHTDHCQKAWLPWFDGLMEANEEYFEKNGEPLFSSHMLDLSEEPLEENISICKKYLERMSKVDLLLEMELGVTGGEEDGVDNTDVDSSRLYTQPEEVWQVYETLSAVPNGKFTVAAAFGNVHGVYAPGNVSLKPVILHNTQKFIKEKLGTDDDKPVSFVFHGGSGSSLEDIRYAIEAGVIKMNIDTESRLYSLLHAEIGTPHDYRKKPHRPFPASDTQWAFWDGMNEYQKKNKDYLQGQIGNPEGAEKPNKKYYDPRMSLRAGEETMADRLVKCMEGCAVALAGVGAYAAAQAFVAPTAPQVQEQREAGKRTQRRCQVVRQATAVAEKTFTKMPASVKPGVVTGQALVDLLNYAKENEFAIPGVNVVSSSSINACMEAAKKAGGPIMVTFSKGGGQFIAGKAADNSDDAASIAGTVAGALHVRQVAKLYGVPVILHTDHCQKAWLPWFDGLMEANEEYFEKNGEPLFSSHMLDLSEEPLEENISICKKYLERMSKVDLLLEMELGVTGGEEDGVDNTDVDSSRLYTQPEEVWQVYETLSAVPNGKFTVAAAFGNVHGVYAPGNVSLKPVILHNTQKFIKEKLGTDDDKPVSFVFHGGSGSSLEDIRYAIEAGVIKMNIDTESRLYSLLHAEIDTQWAFWDGMNEYQKKNKDYLQGQIGNPEGAEKPNKKYYDPRMSLRAGEETMADRLVKCMEDLKCIDRL
ncbi:fba [Symbiodinium sp. CCMP2592]|nr:fba [Symbiodinium sp. CCMP2592]